MDDVVEHEEGASLASLTLGAALYAWRLRAGQRAGRRPGPRQPLPQKTVGDACSLSAKWIGFLERGIIKELPPEAVDPLADVLGLSDHERQFLHAHARGNSVKHRRRRVAPAIPMHLQRLLKQTSLPVYVTDDVWTLLAYNEAMAQWFSWVTEPGANLLRWALLNPEARSVYADWEAQVPIYLALLRMASVAGQRRGDLRLMQLQREVLTDPICRKAWDERLHLRTHRDGDEFRLRLPHISPQEMHVTAHLFSPASQPPLRYVMLSWQDEPSPPEHPTGQ
ncbi:XRE family transcriptional regulator [Streptomyces sp. NPDC050095]|uniref:MmyB family transcriptional regulator n=1 Tax=unclassified Streptomyces TaxID=2593676 RepID=UPI003446786D